MKKVLVGPLPGLSYVAYRVCLFVFEPAPGYQLTGFRL
jgi:hypothetical protein